MYLLYFSKNNELSQLNPLFSLSSDLIFIKSFTKPEVVDAIRHMPSRRSFGLDLIPSYIMKACSHLLSKPLPFTYNLSLCSHMFPKKWTTTKIIPLHKKGYVSDVCNYRPIAILSSRVKIFKLLLCKHIFFFVKCKISIQQRGFFWSFNIIQFSEFYAIHN